MQTQQFAVKRLSQFALDDKLAKWRPLPIAVGAVASLRKLETGCNFKGVRYEVRCAARGREKKSSSGFKMLMSDFVSVFREASFSVCSNVVSCFD